MASEIHMTREQFELRLDHIEMEWRRAMKSVKTIQSNHIRYDARMDSMQRTMNMMVEDLIIQLQMETNITVACSRDDAVGDIPCPPRVHRETTLLNFDNKR